MWKNDPKELLSMDIQDPTDFPPSSTAPGLRALDNALRCKICQELYEAPVVLTCGHCFCSLCARNQLSEKPACPTCWKEAAISSFRVNPTLEEAVTAWKDARPFVLRAIDETIDLRMTAPESSSRPAKRHRPNAPVLSVSPQKQSRWPEFPGSSRGRDRPETNTPDDDVEQDTSSNMSNSTGSVRCPVCGKDVPMAKINGHLDTGCRQYSISSGGTNASSSKSGQKDAWSKLLDGKRSGKDNKEKLEEEVETRTPLPKASYTVLKDKQIRDLLAAHDLSTAGDRSQLISRHERWIALYNANLDRSPALRRRVAELRLEMRRWEEERRGSRKDPLKIDIAEYRRANKAEFEKLVQRARAKPRHESSASLSDRAASSDLNLKGLIGASGSETDTILVTSDIEG